MNHEVQLQLKLPYHLLAVVEDSFPETRLVLTENGRGIRANHHCLRDRYSGQRVNLLVDKSGISLRAVVAQWSRGPDSLEDKVADSRLGRVMSSRLVPLKTRCVERPLHVKSVEAQRSSTWCGVEIRRNVWRLRCHPRHLILV
ncbi:hypothetical protein TNCV_366981 [Trichonephila clavipes]|nr:hypothetical protein TNCV_366981 [Trichonephila clavipes]